jgi:hypothetical protein
MKPKLELNLISTTYGGPERYHPAIRDLDHNIWYWPNVSFQTEQAAYLWAGDTLGRLIAEPLNQIQTTINSWNIHQP